jgi:tetratricopeptide (TPR) repeat protein
MSRSDTNHNDTNHNDNDTEDEDEFSIINTTTKDMANYLVNFGDYKEAIKIYTTLIADNEDYILYSNRSVAYFKLKQYELALKDAVKSTKLNYHYSKSWGRLGACLYCLKRFDKAKVAYIRAYELEQNIIYKNMIDIIDNKDNNEDDMIGNMMDSLMNNSDIMKKISDPKFQDKVLSMQMNPFEAFKDNEIMGIMEEIIKKMK